MLGSLMGCSFEQLVIDIDMLARAHEKVVEVLSGHYPNYLGRKADAAIRARFSIALAPAAIQPGNGR
jgi:trimethylamine:corrinoid methyltransferase-like protein